MRWLIVLAWWFTGLASAAESPVASASVPASGATVIGIEVRIRGPLSFPAYEADAIYFVRRCKGETSCDDALIPSTFASKARVYLVGAPPGTYVAVAAMFQVLKTADRYIVYFPAEVLDATATEVTTDEPQGFAGSFVLRSSIGLCPDTAEAQQLEYAEKLAPGSVKCGMAGTVIDMAAHADYAFVGGMAVPTGGMLYHYRGLPKEAHRDPSDLERLKQLAAADLADFYAKR